MLTTVQREGHEHGSRHKRSLYGPGWETTWRKQGVRPKTYLWKVCEQTCECLAYALKVRTYRACVVVVVINLSIQSGDKVKTLGCLCL